MGYEDSCSEKKVRLSLSTQTFGSCWTRSSPTGPLQSQIDSALLPQWGNTAQHATQIRVPPGTTIYEEIAPHKAILSEAAIRFLYQKEV